MSTYFPKQILKDADLASRFGTPPLQGKTIAILGYGNQGRPQALNLRDSGLTVIVGTRNCTGETARQAIDDGFNCYSFSEASSKADVIMMLLPDEAMAGVFQRDVLPVLTPDKEKTACKAIGFAHGLVVHEQLIQFPDGVDVFLLAPKGQGKGVRNKFISGSGVPGLYAVSQNASGDAESIALAYGQAIGCGRTGLIETTFEEETVCDLFSEQVVLCGGLTQLITKAFETLVEAGYAPEVAYFECLYEVKLVADLIHDRGITGMREGISSTALYGDISQGESVIDGHVKETMRRTLNNITSGGFNRQLQSEFATGKPEIREAMARASAHPIEQVHRQLLSLKGFK
ncbi:MAG: ketol-acid reductoisomerase [Cyanobacteria bacterium P01_H01_bin.74]